MMMDPVHGNAGKRRAGYGLALIAVITCPCHLPILLLLLSGTAAGAFVTDYFAAALALLGVLFLFSVTAAMRLLQGNETENGQLQAHGQENDARPEGVLARPKIPGSRGPRANEEVIQSREHDGESLRL